jgi:acid phosphatase (class A)
MQVYKIILPFLFAFIATSSCAQTSIQEKTQTSLTLELKELHPGILEGYLSEEELPNSLLLVSPPPKEGSAAFALDQEMAAMYVSMDDDERKIQATKDANLHFPEATKAFNIILNTNISEETTPNLYMILRRTLPMQDYQLMQQKIITSVTDLLW